MIKDVENSSRPIKQGSVPVRKPAGTTGRLLQFIARLTLCLSVATTAQAATFNVDSIADEVDANPGDGVCLTASSSCSLRAAIQEANSTANTVDAQGVVQPDTINIPAGTYTLSISGVNEDLATQGDLDIRESVIITGAGMDTTIIDGGAIDRVFQIMAGATVSISNLTVQNGYVDADVNNNVSSGGGSGGAGIYNSGILRIENCKIQQNRVVATTNTGAGGGGIQTTGVAGTGPNTVHTVVLRSIVSNNSAPLGGGIRNFFGRMDIDLTEVDNNTAELSGGGVQNADGGMSITRTTVRNNVAHQTGGGVDNLSALDISQSSIYDNQAVGIITGGVITAGGAGGGLANGAGGALNMINTTVSGNLAALGGGGIYNHRDLTATNSTIYDNSVNQTNGGTEIFACGSQDSTNDCTTGIYVDPADPTKGLLIHTNLVNTIVGNSSTSDNCNGDPADLIISKGHNIETANTCSLTTSSDMPNTDPQFADILKYNGGDPSSLLSLALSAGSPAVDAGDTTVCTATDARNFLRDAQCDIGAYEYGAAPNTSGNVLDLALDITDKVASPLNGTVQVTITFSARNKGPLQATNVVLDGSLPALSWLKITSLGSNSSAGNCTQTTTGFTCTIPTIAAYDSADFFVAVIATQAGSFQAGGEVKSTEVDNYRPDNLKSITIDIPTVAGSSVSGNNFAGSSGGGAMDWLSLVLLFPVVARRVQRRTRPR